MQACCPYLYFDGKADEAMKTYQRVLGGELISIPYSDAPAGAGSPPPGCEVSDTTRVMHAMLKFDAGMLMASDSPNSAMAQPMGGLSVNVMFSDTPRAKKVFDELSAGAQVRMPFARTFWAEGFGVLVDRFGTPWMIGGGVQG